MKGTLPAAIAIALLASSEALTASPSLVPRQEANLELTFIGRSSLYEQGQKIAEQSVFAATMSWLQREPLPKTGWYWGWGVRADRIALASDGDFSLQRLQDCAAQFSLEYYVGTEAAAGLILHPGLYFENHPTAAAWDIPLEFECGVPLSGNWNGVLGFYAARFSRHPVPVVGLVWAANSRFRLEAVFPDPTLIVNLDPQTEVRLGGELEGTGFLSDAHPKQHRIEYSGYHASVKVSREIRPGFKLKLAVGLEFERLFDYLDQSQRVSARGTTYFQFSAELAR